MRSQQSRFPRQVGKVLVITAHPDDETLGCGGTIAKLAAMGSEVRVSWIGSGVGARGYIKGEREQRQKEKLCALRILGALQVSNDFTCFPPDNQFDTEPLINIVKDIENAIRRFKPDAIFTHSQKDLNIDHYITAKAVLTATRPIVGNHIVGSVYAFEVPSATEWAFGQFGTFCPNYFVDVSGEPFAKKIRASLAFESELRDFPHPRSIEAIIACASVRGTQCGFKKAEAFEVVRLLN